MTTEKFVAITWDPGADPFWLTRDYFPDIHEMDKRIFPELDVFSEHFDDVKVGPLPIPSDCADGLLAAFWKRPAAYLSPEVRQATSPFSKTKNLAAGLQTLADDIISGAWEIKNQAILSLSSLDVGYRLISAKVRNA